MNNINKNPGEMSQELSDVAERNSASGEASERNVLSWKTVHSQTKTAPPINLDFLQTEDESRETDLVCLSHLRWDFVYQRPQHLLTRCAQKRRVFFVEEPIFENGPIRLDVSRRDENLFVVVPYLPEGLSSEIALDAVQQGLIDRLFGEHGIENFVLWYYTPMALSFTRHLKPQAVIYDCMDELSAFKNAPRAMQFREKELFNRADVVFTGGVSLYEAKRNQHKNVHAFPSSIDVQHFASARNVSEDPADQANIPHPRLGFCGVIDERMDLDLIAGMADARPDWHLVMIGPVVKIDPACLPQCPNIHYLGGKAYKELPNYLAGWDVALLPFALNESTRFISPTKTPEYLAAGKPVVSTAIRDVVRPYGQKGLVRIAATAEEFVKAAEEALREDTPARLKQVDEFLAQTSWDLTWSRMWQLIEAAMDAERKSAVAGTGRRAVAASAGGGNLVVAS